MDDHIEPELLERFLAGDCTAAEREQVVRWVDGIPERQALLNALRTAWGQIGTPPRRYDSASAWASVSARLRERVTNAGTSEAVAESIPGRDDAGARPSRPIRRAFEYDAAASRWRIAALLLMALGLGGAGLWLYQGRGASRARIPAVAAAAREVVTPRGQRATIHLSDGSTVTLAPGSRLRESPAFGVESRDVSLDGEAYFEVVHNAAKPFRVHTARAVAHDLGTKFVVRAYTQSRDVRVVVVDGSVSLAREQDSVAIASTLPTRSPLDSVVLRARDLGRLDDHDRLTIESNVAVDDYAAWISGRLAFTDAPLDDVIPRLGQWYDVDLRLADSTLGRERFTATFTHEPLSDVLQLLAATVHARVERRGDTLILLRRRGSR